MSRLWTVPSALLYTIHLNNKQLVTQSTERNQFECDDN